MLWENQKQQQRKLTWGKWQWLWDNKKWTLIWENDIVMREQKTLKSTGESDSASDRN